MQITKAKLKQIIKEELELPLEDPGPLEKGEGQKFEKERSWIANYINAWFNQQAAGNARQGLSDDLRDGARGVPGDPWRANVSFNKALRNDGVIAPEDVEHFANALENLANAIEADNTLADPKIIGKKGDWYKYAQGQGTQQMKITKQQLKQIIKEELTRVLNEDESKVEALIRKALAAANLGPAFYWEPNEIENLKSSFEKLGVTRDSHGLEISSGKVEDERGLSQPPGVALAVDNEWYTYKMDPDRGLVDVG